MGSYARLHDLPFVALIAIGVLAAAPRACAEDMFVLNHHRPTLQSLATRPQAAATVATGTADAICVFGNGFNVPTGPCASCFDSTVDFGETDVDCGGIYCKACADGQKCLTNGDCNSTVCNTSTQVCAPATCIDGVKDGTETDIDCGGDCNACTVGKTCLANTDCQSGRCTNNVCADVLLISQVQTRGVGGAADEFVELYNPASVSVTFDSSWTLMARSTTSTSYSTRISGGGQSIPSHGHILYTGTGYTGPTMADALLLSGITDASSLVLLNSGIFVDALCFYYDSTTQSALSVGFTCEGTPISNLPHDNTTNGASNTDASLERKPGGTQGNMQHTGDNAADFSNNATPDPHNLASPPTP